jgi:tripartite-type tricarboxylate transporter receptor subunit TctC
MSILRAVSALLFGFAAFATPNAVLAQVKFPDRPVRLIVPFAPGGSSDILARALAPKLHETFGQPFVIENRTGANGNVGADHVAKSRPDGYTYLLTDVASVAISPSLYPNLPFDVRKELTPVTMIAYAPHLLAVKPALPVKSPQELVAYAKANPGKLNFAHAGNGSAPHLAGVVFRQRTNVEWVDIAYRGGAQAIADVVSGQADFLFNGALATLSYVQNGQLKAIAVSGKARLPQLPDVPTIAESGLPGFETGTYQGLMATGGTPMEIVRQINQAVHAALKQPDITTRLASLGTDPTPNSPEEFKTWFDASVISWAKIVKDAGVKVE